jgi:ribosomal protein L37AE/L43A
MTTHELLPCPFCGTPPQVRAYAKFVRCPECASRGGGAYFIGETIEEACANWNRRVPVEPTP